MKLLFLTMALAAMATAADPPGVVQYTAARLKGFEKELAPKINAQKVATLQLDKWGNHSTMVAHREGDGEAELHENQADIFIVQTGAATLVIGGEVVGGKTTGPGEIRGTSIKGGSNKKLAPGDIVHIPAKLPHQVLVAPGKQFTYLIVKVDEK